MGKVIFWIVVAFAVLLGLRLMNAAKAKQRNDAARRKRDDVAQPMVRCVRCGVFLPSADATKTAEGLCCSDPKCGQRR